MTDIVNVIKSEDDNFMFQMKSFVPILRKRMYTRESFVRQFLVSLISVLDSLPDARTVKYLPEFLDLSSTFWMTPVLGFLPCVITC